MKFLCGIFHPFEKSKVLLELSLRSFVFNTVRVALVLLVLGVPLTCLPLLFLVQVREGGNFFHFLVDVLKFYPPRSTPNPFFSPPSVDAVASVDGLIFCASQQKHDLLVDVPHLKYQKEKRRGAIAEEQFLGLAFGMCLIPISPCIIVWYVSLLYVIYLFIYFSMRIARDGIS